MEKNINGLLKKGAIKVTSLENNTDERIHS